MKLSIESEKEPKDIKTSKTIIATKIDKENPFDTLLVNEIYAI